MCLIDSKAAVGAFGFEHGENAGDTIAGQTEFERLRDVVIIIIIIIGSIGWNTEREDLAHRRVGELIVHPGGDAFCLRDAGDSPIGEFDQPVADRDSVFGRQGGSAANERHVDRHAAPINVFECVILRPLLAR